VLLRGVRSVHRNAASAERFLRTEAHVVCIEQHDDMMNQVASYEMSARLAGRYVLNPV
jgi:hypothetical protein